MLYPSLGATVPLAVSTSLTSGGFIAGQSPLGISTGLSALGGQACPPFVLQQVTGSNVSGFGMGTENMITQDGSFLVAFIGWDTTNTNISLTELPNPAPDVPAVNVTDSAGNMWQQAGITVSEGYSARCAIWVAANAAPVQWVSVATGGFAASVAWTFAEIRYMPQAISIDFSAGDTTAPLATSSLSLLGEAATLAAGGDIVFTMLAVPLSGTGDAALTSGPSGFTRPGHGGGGGFHRVGDRDLPVLGDGSRGGHGDRRVRHQRPRGPGRGDLRAARQRGAAAAGELQLPPRRGRGGVRRAAG